MVIFGGLEFVVGGYLIHRHYRSKSEKKRLETEAHQRRHNTFPGARRQGCPQQRPQHHQQHHQRPQPQQKYAHRDPQYRPPPPHQSRPQAYSCSQPQPHSYHRPHAAQTFPQNQQPYPPQPNQYPSQPQIQPLRRTDSLATLSNIPVPNGSPPSDLAPYLPPRPPHQLSQNNMLALPSHPYGNAGFSMSTPALDHDNASTIYTPSQIGGEGRYTVDDNWETYAPHSPHVRFNVQGRQPGDSVAAEDGVDDAPPPYRP